MNSLSHTITLVLGDWSDDGHGKTYIIMIESNLDQEEIMAAYKKASKKLGFKLLDDVCADYEDRSISAEYFKTLVTHGLKIEDVFNTDYDRKLAQKSLQNDGDDIGLWTDSYTNIFLFIVKLGNQEFEYKITDDEAPRINIGGYGLFE